MMRSFAIVFVMGDCTIIKKRCWAIVVYIGSFNADGDLFFDTIAFERN
jgi:hypothetical protein